jgi:hypothetical protein
MTSAESGTLEGVSRASDALILKVWDKVEGQETFGEMCSPTVGWSRSTTAASQFHFIARLEVVVFE